jgi:hypothetical protein
MEVKLANYSIFTAPLLESLSLKVVGLFFSEKW